MLEVGEQEIEAIAGQLRRGKIFRYQEDGQCALFEQRFAAYHGGKYVQLTASGSNSLVAALASLGVGPGDEVIVPAHTYMATAIGVLQVGAIPVIIDVDESIMMSPEALADAIGPRTKAVIPVHMWGAVCNMRAIMKVARKHKLLVVEDCCQCIGGGCDGRMVGSFGDAGCFSFNYFKNITCGEGGAVMSRTKKAHEKVRCLTDCCGFFWTGRRKSFEGFAAPSARASELQGAMLNVQLNRLPGLIKKLRRQKRQILKATAACGLTPTPSHSPDWECALKVMYLLPTAEQARRFAAELTATIAGQTGRHTYTEWEPVLKQQGHIHPELNPYKMAANRGCRMQYSTDMLPQSLDILNRTVMIGLSPQTKAVDRKALEQRIRAAAGLVL